MKPRIDLRCGDCLVEMPKLAPASIDAIITDPPYAEIDRPYGKLTELQWWDLMMVVCREVRRLLKPMGSAVFIVQPNSKRVGQMRGWVFEFMAWICREWNMVQDAYWWNVATLPSAGATTKGLMRGALKPCIWCGDPECYRNQNMVLWDESLSNTQKRVTARIARQYKPSGHSVNEVACTQAAVTRGGVTPFNILPIPNTYTKDNAGANGHGAGTPLELAKWWTRYIVPTGGMVLDPFMGSGTMGLAALEYNNSFIGIEKNADYFAIAQRRIAAAQAQLNLSELTKGEKP